MKRLFEENTICRLCLRVDEKAYKIDNTIHKTFIESVIKLKKNLYVLPDDLYVCYICKVLLAKFFNFAQTVWKTQEIISEFLKTRDIITKPMLDHIDRHNNGLNPITLSSVVTYENKTINNSGDNNDSFDNGYTSTDIEEVESTDIIEVESTDIEENESTDIEEIDLDLLVDKMKKDTKKEQKRKKNKQKRNSSSDENEETVTCNLDEEEVEIGKIGKETSDIFVDSLIEDACYKSRPTRPRQKPKKLVMQEKIRKISKNLYPIEAKNESSTANEKECKNESDEINEDYHHDSTSISTANENKRMKKSDEINKDYRHDSPSSSTDNEHKRKKKSVEIDEDYRSDSTSSSYASEKKIRKKKDEVDKDYCPDSTSHSEDSEYDSYDDEGKPIRRPKDTRVYPMKCDHCDFMVPEKRDHYRHYQYYHLDVEYPYKATEHVTCKVCGKLIIREKIRVHEDTHITRNFKCSLCPNKEFPDRVRLYRHRSTVHPKKTFTCDYCSKVFKTKAGFIRHIWTHTGVKPYKCHICGKAFTHGGNRIIHIRLRHQNYKDKPKTHEKPKKKLRKTKKYSTNKEVYGTSDDEPLVRVTTNPQHISKTPSEDSNVKPKMKRKKQGRIQNGIEESRKRKTKPK